MNVNHIIIHVEDDNKRRNVILAENFSFIFNYSDYFSAESDNECDELVKKYDKLAKKCESIKLDNERLINNICQIKKIIHKYQKQRRFRQIYVSNYFNQ